MLRIVLIAVTLASCSDSETCGSCPTGSTCVGGACLTVCTEHGDCSIDEICYGGVCVGGHLRPGAVVSDGSGDDGGGGSDGQTGDGDLVGDPGDGGGDGGDIVAVCGNDVIEGDEACDGIDLGGEDACSDFGWVGLGPVTCMPTCVEYDLSQCTTPPGNCGSGNPRNGQQCDGGNNGEYQTCEELGFTGGTLDCNNNCTYDVSLCIL